MNIIEAAVATPDARVAITIARFNNFINDSLLEGAIDALKRNDIAVLLDVVVNHKMGADEKEAIRVQRVNADDRTQIDEEIIECEGWTRYTFPARAGQYSQFI